ncbi:uncharacterized protein METZ01_LOCUS201861, partial [marine metagenome]
VLAAEPPERQVSICFSIQFRKLVVYVKLEIIAI